MFHDRAFLDAEVRSALMAIIWRDVMPGCSRATVAAGRAFPVIFSDVGLKPPLAVLLSGNAQNGLITVIPFLKVAPGACWLMSFHTRMGLHILLIDIIPILLNGAFLY